MKQCQFVRLIVISLLLVFMLGMAYGESDLPAKFVQIFPKESVFTITKIKAKLTETSGGGLDRISKLAHGRPGGEKKVKLEILATVINDPNKPEIIAEVTNDNPNNPADYCHITITFFDSDGFEVLATSSSKGHEHGPLISQGETGTIQWSEWIPADLAKRIRRGEVMTSRGDDIARILRKYEKYKSETGPNSPKTGRGSAKTNR